MGGDEESTSTPNANNITEEGSYRKRRVRFIDRRRSAPVVDEQFQDNAELGSEGGGETAAISKRHGFYNFSTSFNGQGLKVRDHFSLHAPVSAVKFDQAQTYIFATQMDQLVLEKRGDEILARRIQEDSPGYVFARGSYSIIAFLMAGFLFVFCIQLLLFLILGLAIEYGLTSQHSEIHYWAFTVTILSLPVFCYGVANAMAIAQAFIIETWEGNPILKTTQAEDSIIIDWVDVFVYILIPAATVAITLAARMNNWWDTTALVWFMCVFVYYLIFAIVCIFYEVNGTLELIRFHPKLRDVFRDVDEEDDNSLFTFRAIKTAILLRQRQVLSGYKTVSFIERDTDDEITKSVLSLGATEHMKRVRFTSPWTLLTHYLCCTPFFNKVTDPENNPRYLIDEVRDETPFLTSYTWGLEKFCCRDRNKRYVAIVGGPGKLSRRQAISSMICTVIGRLLVLFALGALLIWLQLPNVLVGIIIALQIMYSIAKLYESSGLMNAYTESSRLSINSPIQSDAIFKVRATYRVNEATELFCWVSFVLEILLLFILPTIGLFTTKNYNVAWVFSATAIITALRRFFSSAVALQELGSLDGMETNNPNQHPDEEWREKHRLGTIVGKISQGKRHRFWIKCFLFFIAGFLLIFLRAVVEGSDEGRDVPLEPLHDFQYEGNKSMKYPTCKIGKQFQVSNEDSSLADFVFMALAGFQKPSITQDALDGWFGEGVAVDEKQIVKDFQAMYQEENGSSAVTYKLISFPDTNRAIVSIRGTHNSWDALTDAQLWGSAALAQYVRASIPFGDIWTGIFEKIVKAVSIIESSRLEDISFYQETTAFVKKLKEDNMYDSISLTGHSLGGGLASITGAQTESPAVSVSGPNNMLSRLTFDPILSKDDLNEYVFAIIPDRDIVPRIDDVGKLFQKIDCRAPMNNPLQCHFAKRTLCEIIYQCGSEGRPVFCFCTEYGYSVPTATGNRTHEEACPYLY